MWSWVGVAKLGVGRYAGVVRCCYLQCILLSENKQYLASNDINITAAFVSFTF